MAQETFGRFSKILVVDGCAATRETTHKMLHGLGYQALDFVGDGRSALRLIGHTNYGLVLSDWDVPSSGLDLLREARNDQRRRCLPFLMAIGQWQKKFIEIVRSDGATLYMTKPYTATILSERMQQVSSDANKLRLTLSAQASPSAAVSPNASPEASQRVSALWRSLRPVL